MRKPFHIVLIAASSLLCACNAVDESQFVGTWKNACEVEVDGLGFYPQVETLSLREDNSFTIRIAYLDGTLTDTIATTTISGTWEVNDSCLEMRYKPTTLSATSIVMEHESIFFNNMLSQVTYNNEQLTSAHNEGKTFGIKNVAVSGDSLISKSVTGSLHCHYTRIN